MLLAVETKETNPSFPSATLVSHLPSEGDGLEAEYQPPCGDIACLFRNMRTFHPFHRRRPRRDSIVRYLRSDCIGLGVVFVRPPSKQMLPF